MDGFVKLFRKITEWEWYSDANTFRVFMHLLLKANYKDKRLLGREIKRGQLAITAVRIAQDLRLSESAVRRVMKKLQTSGEISVKATNEFSVVTILKYGFYQDMIVKSDGRATDETQTDDEQTTNKHQQHNKENKVNKENKEITTTMCSDSDDILNFYTENICKPSAIEKSMLLDYKAQLCSEAIRYAIEQAVINGRKNCGYVIGICKQLADEGVNNADKLYAHMERAENMRRNRQQSYVNRNMYGTVCTPKPDRKHDYMRNDRTYTDSDLFDIYE